MQYLIINFYRPGREMEKKPAHQGLRKDLDRIQTLWDKLKRETVDRYTRLQAAMVSGRDICDKSTQII